MRLFRSQLRCSPSQVGLLTRQLAALVEGGVPLARALDSLAEFAEDGDLRQALEEVLIKVEQGHAFSRSLADFPGVFPYTYVAMVSAGEQTGQLNQVLDNLATWLERDEESARQIRKAMVYPSVVLSLALGMLAILFWTIIPGMLETVQSLGGELPLPTILLAKFSACLNQPIFLVMAPLSLLPVVAYLRTPGGKADLYVRLRGVPGLGAVLLYGSASRYAAALGMLLDSGNSLVSSTRIAAEASGNPILRDDCRRLNEGLEGGQTLSELWAIRVPDYPLPLVHMMRAGEEASEVVAVLRKNSEMMAEEASYRLERMTAMLEPALLGAVAVVVGFIVVALLMPLANVVANL
ncbi:MAG: type II secretion system F family protein [Candidatus Eremiobacteraeota bacterium]|nr:type II secretion system F family protein [Candidatus Eremiobacteraeota bacterium]